jgi:GNAT superfamily N-acetyltransferase
MNLQPAGTAQRLGSARCLISTMADLRHADLSRDLPVIRELWSDYLTWGSDELAARHGFRLPVHDAVERDLANIAKFQPPQGAILLAFVDDSAVGIACLQRIGPDTAEVKRMYVRPSARQGGLGRALLARLIETARQAGYKSLRLDSSRFMTAAHALYRASGFVEVPPYPESEIPDAYKCHWIFMEKSLV